MGASKPWPEAMEEITGQRKMNVAPLLEYFAPLIEFLEKENNNERPGWSAACPSDDALQGKKPVAPPVQFPCDPINGASSRGLVVITLCFAVLIHFFSFLVKT